MIHKPTKDLIEACRTEQSKAVQFGNYWIMLDRDRVPEFDRLIRDARKYDIRAAWSNPCIEVWLQMHWENVHHYVDAENCTDDFRKTFKRKTGREYKKADKDIFRILNEYGNAGRAMKSARDQLNKHERDITNCKISDMDPGTEVHTLIKEIMDKTQN